MFNLFCKGLIMGLAIAAPVGPIGMLCMQRSLQDGFRIGFMTGVGAALADGVYGMVAGFGLTSISSFIIKYQLWIRGIGGLFLIYVGVALFFKVPPKRFADRPVHSAFKACAMTFLLTLANPATILSFTAILAGLGVGMESSHVMQVILLVLGITLGSMLWWFMLSGGVAFILHSKLGEMVTREINWISGMVMVILGMVALGASFL